jgi:hypothetical protein
LPFFPSRLPVSLFLFSLAPLLSPYFPSTLPSSVAQQQEAGFVVDQLREAVMAVDGEN